MDREENSEDDLKRLYYRRDLSILIFFIRISRMAKSQELKLKRVKGDEKQAAKTKFIV